MPLLPPSSPSSPPSPPPPPSLPHPPSPPPSTPDGDYDYDYDGEEDEDDDDDDSSVAPDQSTQNLESSDGDGGEGYVWADWEIIIVAFSAIAFVAICAILLFTGARKREASVAKDKASTYLSSTEPSMASNALDEKA